MTLSNPNCTPTTRLRRLVALCALTSVLAACAFQPELTPELGLEEQVQLLQKQFKFGEAQRALENSNPARFEAAKAKSLLKYNSEIASQHERTVIAKADNLQLQGKWGEALALYDNSLTAYPESTRLDDAAKRLFIARDEFRNATLLEYNILRAKRLPSELHSLQQLSDATPKATYVKDLEGLQQEANDVAEFLLLEGQKLMANSHWRNAKELLELSNTLRPDSRTRTALRVTKANYTGKQKNKVAKRVAKPVENVVLEAVEPSQELVATVMLKYRYALQKKDLSAAQVHLQQAQQLRPLDADISAEREQLDTLIDSTVAQYLEQGKYQYSLGNIDQAITHWTSAYELAPNDESLKERLDKARRFKQRYEQLKR